MKLLITGAAGFVASSLIDFFNKYNPTISITGIDNFSYGYKERLKGLNLNFKEIDIKDFTESEKYINNYDAVIHCAAIAPLPDNEIDPPKSYENNVVNTMRIADYCTRIGCKKLIFFSSGAIYENDVKFPSEENIHHQTSLVYPTSKMCAEHALKAYSESYLLNTYSLRLFNLYGPRQDYFRKQPPLIGYLLSCILSDQAAILFSSGEQRRDYIYIEDVYKIVNEIISRDDSCYYTALNIGSGITYSVNEIVDFLKKISNKDLRIIRKEAKTYWDKYPDLFNKELPLNKNLIDKEVLKYSEADITKLKNVLSFEPVTSIEKGLRECYEYALRHYK